MKKVISVLLLLTMVIGCFAGCTPEVKEDPALNSAAEYLYAMYKDSDAKTAVDYAMVGQVRINDVDYPITWTVDKTDNVQIEEAENNMVAIKLIPSTTEDITYKLTATLKNSEGATASVSFEFYIPKADGLPATLADGTYVILNGNLTMSSLSADKSYGYPTATEVTVADGAVTGYVAADVLTIKNVDGGFTIQDAQGRYFYLKGSYNSFNVSETAPEEGHVFSILSKDGKYLIQNNLDKKTLAYSSSYSSWGCYPELTDDHGSLVDIIAVDAAGTATPDSGNTDSGSTSGGSSSSGNTSTSDTSWTKVTSLNTGDKVIIVNPASSMVLSMTKVSTFYNAGVTVSGSFSGITNDEIFTVTKNSDGSYTFTSVSGKVLALADEYSSLNDTGANDKWELSEAGSGQFYLKNVVRGNYLDWYASKGNWSTYAPEELTQDYVLEFYKQG